MKKSRTALWTCLFLAVVTIGVYWPVTRCEFVHFDDPFYVSNNLQVQRGLTWDNVRWALTAKPVGNWHPLTWMSHMLDCQLYGLNPAGHHLTNLLLHTANSILIFLLFRRMTGSQWRSAFVAALFALHPLHVESVAWVAERKDVLSTFFWALTLLAYVRYAQGGRGSRVEGRGESTLTPSLSHRMGEGARRAGEGSLPSTLPALDSRHSTVDYFLVLLFFTLGLMAKPMLVTLPFLLLLLDFWPLGRLRLSFGQEAKIEGALTPSLSHPMGEGAPLVRRSLGEGGRPSEGPGVGVGEGNPNIQQPPSDIQHPMVEKTDLGTGRPHSSLSHPPSLELRRTGPMGEGRGEGSPPSTLNQHPTTLARLLLEKVPLFILSGASCAVTLWAQGYAVGVLHLPFTVRLQNALVSYFYYIVKALWPTKLVVIYPFDPQFRISHIVAMVLICWLSYRIVSRATRVPYMFTGWFWFLGTLIPVIGLVQVGLQSMADRYTYVPLIGIFIIIAWGGYDFAIRSQFNRPMIATVAAALLLACIPITYNQISYWHDTVSLFEHALKYTSNNYSAENDLAVALSDRGDLAGAAEHFKNAIRIFPRVPQSHFGLAYTFIKQGKYNDALPELTEAVRIWPEYAEALGNLGLVLVANGRVDEGIARFRAALRKDPSMPETHYNLACALVRKGRTDEALEELRTTLRLNPRFTIARSDFAALLFNQGMLEESKAQWSILLRDQPDNLKGHLGLGMTFAREKNWTAAIGHFNEAIRLQPGNPEPRIQLGEVLVRKGDLAGAVVHFSEAVKSNPTNAALRSYLAQTEEQTGDIQAALAQYREALNLSSNIPAVLNNMAWILASHPDDTIRNGSEAVRLAEQACELTDYRLPIMIGTLSAAYAEAGQFDKAVETAKRAESLANELGNAELAGKDRDMAELFRSRKPFRQNDRSQSKQ